MIQTMNTKKMACVCFFFVFSHFSCHYLVKPPALLSSSSDIPLLDEPESMEDVFMGDDVIPDLNPPEFAAISSFANRLKVHDVAAFHAFIFDDSRLSPQ